MMVSRRTVIRGFAAAATTSALVPGLTLAPARASEWEKPGDMAIGAADAPVTIIEYFSLTCPHCRAFHVDIYPQIKKEYVDTGKARYVARDFPLNRPALHAAILAHCAGPDRYFAFIDTLFSTFDDWTRASNYLKRLAQLGELGGVTRAQFQKCLDDGKIEAAVLQSIIDGQSEYDVGSTPTFIVNGKKHVGGMRFEKFSGIIDRLIVDS